MARTVDPLVYDSYAFVQDVNRQKLPVDQKDFTVGEYESTKNFITELSKYQTQLLSTGEVTLETGEKASIDNIGGAMAINLSLQALDDRRQATSGLAKAGLKNENKMWTLQ
jgi:hypothetical protein